MPLPRLSRFFGSALLAIAAAIVLLDIGFPCCFWQQRVGLGGLRIATVQAGYSPLEGRHLSRKGQRIPEEQRLSASDGCCVWSAIDELPQLLNVLVGDMSLIGPRPLLPQDQPPNAAVRAQVTRRQLSASEKAALDVWYIRNASLALDLRIIGMTFVSLLRGDRRCERALAQAQTRLIRPAQAGRGERAGSQSVVLLPLAVVAGTDRANSRDPMTDADPVTVSLCSSERSTPIWQGRAGISDEQEICLRRAGPRMQPASRSAARRIIFINRFFFPDHSATSQILTDLAFHLAGCGVGVEVVASRQRYDDPRAALAKAERVGGVTIHRLSATRFGRAGLAGRGFDYLSYGASAYRRLLACTRPGDVLVVKTDPPLLAVAAMRAARRRGLYLVNWLQDLYPEIAAELGVPLAGGRFGRVLLDRRDAALRAADANVVVGEGMAARVRARGVAAERVRVIPNWCDDEEIQPVAPVANPLRREWGLDHHFVVGYSGNLGRAHEIATMLAAAERLRGDQRFKFLFIGGGNGFRDLAAEVRDRRLGHCIRLFSLPGQRAASSFRSGSPTSI